MYEYLYWDVSYETMGFWGRFLYSVPFMLGTLIGAFVYAKNIKRRSYFYLRTTACLFIGLSIAYFIWPIDWKIGIYGVLLKYVIFFIFSFLSLLFCYSCTPFVALFFTENGVVVFSISKLIFDLIGIANAYFSLGIVPYGFWYSLIYFAISVVVYIIKMLS